MLPSDDKPERIGKFEISGVHIRNRPLALAILAGCVPVKVEGLFHRDTIEYIAYGEHFEPASRCAEVPRYDVIIRDIVGGKYHVTFRKSEQQK